MVGRWSRLTPSGFPIEFMLADADITLRWSAEIAGPEIAEASRLERVAAHLAEAGQPVAPALLDALGSLQHERDLEFGAWLGGRASDVGPPRFKLYAEVPAGTHFDELPLPRTLRDACARAPVAAMPRMIGIEPARGRVEVYLRLPAIAPDDLRPVLAAAGHERALESLERHLPDGRRRLAGRRLGMSLAVEAEQARSVDVALFASVRTLFPAAPEMLQRLIPATTRVAPAGVRFTLVTIGLDVEREAPSFAVGITLGAVSRLHY